MSDTVTDLQSAFPAPPPVQQQGAGTSTADVEPYGATKKNPYGAEAKPLGIIAEQNKNIIGDIKEAGENQVNRALINQEGAEAEDTAQQGATHDLNTLNDMHAAELQKEMDRAKPMIEAADKFQFHQYWSDAPTANKVLAAMSSALLGFGTGQYHNVAMEIAEKDHQRQVNELNGLMERARMAGASVDRLREIHRDALQNMQLMKAAQMQAIAKQYARMGAGAATLEAQNAAKLGEHTAAKKAAQEMDEWYKGVRHHTAHTVSQRIAQPKGTRPGD